MPPPYEKRTRTPEQPSAEHQTPTRPPRHHKKTYNPTTATEPPGGTRPPTTSASRTLRPGCSDGIGGILLAMAVDCRGRWRRGPRGWWRGGGKVEPACGRGGRVPAWRGRAASGWEKVAGCPWFATRRVTGGETDIQDVSATEYTGERRQTGVGTKVGPEGPLPTPWVRLRSRKLPYLTHILSCGRSLLLFTNEISWTSSQRSKTPIQNAFGWWMGLDGNGWAVRPAVTIHHTGCGRSLPECAFRRISMHNASKSESYVADSGRFVCSVKRGQVGVVADGSTLYAPLNRHSTV